MLFSIRWQLLPSTFSRTKNTKVFPIVRIQTTFLDEDGKEQFVVKLYREWIGVCTSRIDRVVQNIKTHFPGHKVFYEQLTCTKKILPYFEQRLETGKLNYRDKPFYKLYTTACNEEVGKFFNVYKIGYFEKTDWSVRLYLDLCTKYDSTSFLFKWYEVDPAKEYLLDAFTMRPQRTDPPKWTIVAYDLETVNAAVENRFPTGADPDDVVVMISVVKWREGEPDFKSYVLYVEPFAGYKPLPMNTPSTKYVAYKKERDMLNDFHHLIKDCQVLTGFNINAYDAKFLLLRLLWLQMYNFLQDYSSVKYKNTIVVTFRDKIVVDMMFYFKEYASNGLSKYSLDHIAEVILGERKIDVNSTGITSWYAAPEGSVRKVAYCEDVKTCYDKLKVTHIRNFEKFATFRGYLEYCLVDSDLARKLFLKQNALSFLVERANFTAANISLATYAGTSVYLLELFKSYGTRLGFFFNHRFFKNPIDIHRYKSTFVKSSKGLTYQGALNYCVPQTTYEDVSVMDFTSMYPSAIYSCNLSYETCSILERSNWTKAIEKFPQLASIPYRIHKESQFFEEDEEKNEHFAYPTPNENDKFIMVMYREHKGYLPRIIEELLRLRKINSQKWTETRNSYYYNVQLCIKILVNSMYGVMGGKDDRLAFPPIAMGTVNVCREQIIGSFKYIRRLGYDPIYVDTDSLFVHRWPENNCDAINEYLHIPFVDLKYEKRLLRLLVLSKKRYAFQVVLEYLIRHKGLLKIGNGVQHHSVDTVLQEVWKVLFGDEIGDPGVGWCIWTNLLLQLQYMCRDPHKYSLHKKAKPMHEYKQTSCSTYRFLERYPDKTNDYVDYTYGKVDVAKSESKKFVLDPDDCQQVSFDMLFVNQQSALTSLLDMTFWKLGNKMSTFYCQAVFNAIRWKGFLHAELKNYIKTRKKLMMIMENGVSFSFRINDFLYRGGQRGKSGVKDKPKNKRAKVGDV